MNTIHINLVSDQLIPNLIPTLSDPACDGIILVLGDSSRESEAELLTQIYQKHGKPILWKSTGESSTRFDTLHQQAKQVLQTLESTYPSHQWVLNATGGTKPMSIAFTTVFNENSKSLVIYTDTQNREIQIIKPGIAIASLPFCSILSMEDYLLANHFQITSYIDSNHDSDVQLRAGLSRYLMTENTNILLSKILTNIGDVDDSQILQQLPLSIIGSSCFELYKRLNEDGLIAWREDTQQIVFTSKSAKQYLTGGWLEELTYLTAKECNPKHVMMNVKGNWLKERIFNDEESYIFNEFDVLVIHNNQLLIIECKSGQWYKNTPTEQDIITKLDSLSQKLGGLFGSKCLITTKPISPSAFLRTKQNQIRCCQLANRRKIKNEIKIWLKHVS